MNNKCNLIIGIFITLLCSFKVNANPLTLPAIQVIPIEDSVNNRQYELYIKLPKTYEADTKKTHPVIYITDALWHIEILSGSAEHLLKDSILVGISWEKGLPEQRSRMRDYMPNKYEGADYPHSTGLADQHLNFITKDVFQLLETQFKGDPEQRSFFGYSVSGTFGAYALLTKPSAFKNYIIGSPVTLFGDHFIHEYDPIKSLIPKNLDANILIAIGADDSEENINHATSLVRYLKNKIHETNGVSLIIIESADHSSAFPMVGVKSMYWLAKKLSGFY